MITLPYKVADKHLLKKDIARKPQSDINQEPEFVKWKHINFNLSDIELKFTSTPNVQDMNELTKDERLREFKTN